MNLRNDFIKAATLLSLLVFPFTGVIVSALLGGKKSDSSARKLRVASVNYQMTISVILSLVFVAMWFIDPIAAQYLSMVLVVYIVANVILVLGWLLEMRYVEHIIQRFSWHFVS